MTDYKYKYIENLLTKDEINKLEDLKEKYENDKEISKAAYEESVKIYLEEINFDERLTVYLKDKWFIKLLAFFVKLKNKISGTKG